MDLRMCKKSSTSLKGCPLLYLKTMAVPDNVEKSNITHLQKGQEEGFRKLQVDQPYLTPGTAMEQFLLEAISNQIKHKKLV